MTTVNDDTATLNSDEPVTETAILARLDQLEAKLDHLDEQAHAVTRFITEHQAALTHGLAMLDRMSNPLAALRKRAK